MSVITLTDGGANWSFGSTMGDDDKVNHEGHGDTPVIKIGKKSYSSKGDHIYRSDQYTGLLLDILRTEHQVSTIGFFVTKKIRTWEFDRYINNYKDYQDKEKKRLAMRSSMTKNRFAPVDSYGYSKYFLLNGKKLNIENTNLDSINDNMKSRGIAKLFKKSMKGRITSRILLNQFIQEVA
jgi:SET domain-containing protein